MGFFKKLGPHYAIERFGVLFLSLTLCLALLVTAIVTKKVEFDHRSLSGNAVYTRAFSMSQTGTTGSVKGVYSNNAHTKVFVLLQMDDMAAIPTDANDYRLLIGGSTPSGAYTTLKSNPSGLLYVFGSTGYFGVYLEDVNGFPSQLVQFYIEALVNLTGDQNSDGNQYNRALVYFNPGGSYATHADFLEKSNWQVFDMVEEIMTRSQERALRITLREDLFEMAKLKLLSDEYIRRLTEYGVIVPTIPAEIDDSIYALANDKSVTEQLHYISSYGGGWVDSTGSKGFRNDAVTLYLDSDYTCPGGFDFNWQDGRILTGYLESLTGSTSLDRWASYLNEHKDENRQTSFESAMSAIQWKFTDGTVVKMVENEESATQRDRTISDLIIRLEQNWRSYYELKTKYQVTDLGSLLRLESNGRNSVDSYTVNDGSNFTVYK